MKPSDFKASLIRIVAPSIIDLYEHILIPKLLDISKPAFEKLLCLDESNPILKHDWADLYLDYERNYEQIKSEFVSELTPSFSASSIPKDYLSKEIDDEYANKFIDTVKTLMNSFSFEEILNSSNEINFDEIHESEFQFLRASIVQFYNSLSVIQSDQRINSLVKEFIEKRKELSLIKAVKVDPTVLCLAEVQNAINQFDPIKRNKLETKIQNAKSIPHLTPDKRKKHLTLAVFLNLTASLGYLSASKPITNKRLRKIAIDLKLITDDYDDDEFRRTVSYYRKIPFSRG